MTYTHQHVKLTFGGTMPGGEIWQCGMRLGFLDGDVTEAAFNLLDPATISGIIETFVTAGTTAWVDDIAYRWVKLAHVGTTGDYLRDPRVHETAAPVVGTISTRHPLQVAWCVTLASGSTLGRANFGRFYLPPLGYNRQSGSGAVATTSVQAVLTNVSTMLDGIRDHARRGPVSAPYELLIMSELGTGRTKPVAEVRLGCVPDTQRRRRNRLDENYQTVAFPLV